LPVIRCGRGAGTEMPAEPKRVPKLRHKLPTLDAHGEVGIREIAKAELLTLMSKKTVLCHALEKAQVDRGCRASRVFTKVWVDEMA